MMQNLKFNFNKAKFDSISKFNIFNERMIIKENCIIFFSKLSTSDASFLQDFFFLSKLFFHWLNKKIIILKNFLDKKRNYNKGKSSLIFFFGCTIRNYFLWDSLDYMKNIIFLFSKKIDGEIKYKQVKDGFIFNFSNINFLLGFKSERFFNVNVKINIFLNFSLNYNKNNFFKKKVIKFYEKVFF